jgi:hypothetical protein
MPRLKTGADSRLQGRCLGRAEFLALPYRRTPLGRFLNLPPENGQRVLNVPMAIHLFRVKIHQIGFSV